MCQQGFSRKMKSNLIQFQGQSAGSYSDSAGIEVIRRHVADYIKERDGGIPSNWENIILCAGASEGIRVSGISPSFLQIGRIIYLIYVN